MEYDYKNEIEATRVGCVGSSDAKMLSQIASLGYVPKSALKRLAVLKGFKEQEHVSSREIAFGDYIENQIYAHLKATNPNYESNPCFVSEKYSRENVKCIDHPDIVLKDEEKQTLFIYECKATKFSFRETRVNYAAQLFHHDLMAKEAAEKMGKKWHSRVFLLHYDTNGVDLNEEWTFDPSRLSIIPCKFNSGVYNLYEAMNILNEFLSTFDAYYEDEEIDLSLLPTNVQKTLTDIAYTLKEIQDKEKKVSEFKDKLFSYLCEKGIKSIKNEYFNITRVDASESTSFDSKAYLADLEQKQPIVARRIKKKYEKKTQRKGYAKIDIKNVDNK